LWLLDLLGLRLLVATLEQVQSQDVNEDALKVGFVLVLVGVVLDVVLEAQEEVKEGLDGVREGHDFFKVLTRERGHEHLALDKFIVAVGQVIDIAWLESLVFPLFALALAKVLAVRVIDVRDAVCLRVLLLDEF
jgi:hypothetical protein